MRHRLLKAVGYAVVWLMFGGLWMTVILAVRADQVFSGTNARGLQVGTWSALILLTLATLAGLLAGLRQIFRFLRQLPSKRSMGAIRSGE